MEISSEKWKKAEPFLEVMGMAVALTFIQIIVVYVVLGTSPDTFRKYTRPFFEKFLTPIDALYNLFLFIISRILGSSYLNTPGFKIPFEIAFFIVFLVNVAYFALQKMKK